MYLALKWQEALNSSLYASQAELAKGMSVSRARVTQVLQLLQLAPEALALLEGLGNPFSFQVITERKLRQITKQSIEQQVHKVKTLILLALP